jgi:threonine dehydratase
MIRWSWRAGHRLEFPNPDVANIIIPIGGGGLIPGCATSPGADYRVEAAAAPSMHYSLRRG